MSFDVPVLLITWRRPDTTRQVIDALRAVAPKTIYVASDGPRHAKEEKQVKATRAVIDEFINWPCSIYRRFSVVNQGCEVGVSSAITWFFDSVEEGIILEDDCIPSGEFFGYCRELLVKFRNDERVWCISGGNYQQGHWRGEGSYYFSRYNHCWGWASWRRCWQQYADHDAIWSIVNNSMALQKSMFDCDFERRYWMEIWRKLFTFSQPDTWDYRWSLVCMANSGLTILPNANLVMNIGFGEGALHTAGQSTAVPLQPLGHVVHPRLVCRHAEADSYTFDEYFGGRLLKSRRYWLKIKLSRIKYFLLRCVRLVKHR